MDRFNRLAGSPLPLRGFTPVGRTAQTTLALRGDQTFTVLARAHAWRTQQPVAMPKKSVEMRNADLSKCWQIRRQTSRCEP